MNTLPYSEYQKIDIGPVPEGLQGVIINDCDDANARLRQQVRFQQLFGVLPTFVELGEVNPDLEAAGHLVDALEASRVPKAFKPKPTVVLVNVAPRGDDVREKWENGTPFCATTHGQNTILAPYEGRALSLASKLGLVQTARLLDIPEVTEHLAGHDLLSEYDAEAIDNTQFRSLEFLPLAARLLVGAVALPAERLKIGPPYPDAWRHAWFIDNFGNVKTSLLPDEVDFAEGQTVRLLHGHEVVCHQRLTDVPSGATALTVGSSGYDDDRWLELVVQRGNAAKQLGISIGDEIR